MRDDHLAIPISDDDQPTYTLAPWGVVEALCHVLAHRPDLRSRLDEPARAGLLAEDTRSSHLVAPSPAGGLLPSTLAVHGVMQVLGIRHRFGRPIDGEPLPDRSALIERIENRMATSPYATSPPRREKIADVLDREYLDVEPWPFRALTLPIELVTAMRPLT
jgi:hypothetical protein